MLPVRPTIELVTAPVSPLTEFVTSEELLDSIRVVVLTELSVSNTTL
jgi:hypothetical protein